MDPQIKSILTSVGLGLASAAIGWAVKQGYISAADQSADANYLVGAVGVLVAAAIGWYKTRSVTPKAMIEHINATDNGLKVVSASVPAKTETAPLK